MPSIQREDSLGDKKQNIITDGDFMETYVASLMKNSIIIKVLKQLAHHSLITHIRTTDGRLSSALFRAF